MTHAFKLRLCRTVCSTAMAVFISLSLASCLPGKEEEKKVIGEAQEATHSVQANKVAADLTMAAQKLVSSTSQVTNNNELKTVACGTKVVAYVPKASKLNKNGTMPGELGNRLRDELKAAVKDAGQVTDASGALCATISDIAVNSPVLVMDSIAAAVMATSPDNSAMASIEMLPCTGNRPGVIIKKTMYVNPSNHAAGTTVVIDNSHCGQAVALNTLPSFSVGNFSMPKYKDILNNSPTIANANNFKCFTNSTGCVPMNQVAQGTKIICDAETESQDLMVNPSWDSTNVKFKPNPSGVDCGRNWSGELTARVKQQQCQVVRTGSTQASTPTKVFDIAYVGAKCSKKDVVTTSACPPSPLSFPFYATGHMMQKEDMKQTETLLLTPIAMTISNQNISGIAYETPDHSSTNMDWAAQALLGQQSVVKVGGTVTENFFKAQSNLSAVPTPQFDQEYVTQLRELSKIQREGTPTCYALAQDCYIKPVDSNIEIIVDRSQPMQAANPTTVYQSYTSCRATMANLFRDDQRGAACQKAASWKSLAASSNVIDTVVNGWNYTGFVLGPLGLPMPGGNTDPVVQGNSRLTSAKNGISASVKNQLDTLEADMVSALKMTSMSDRLRYALAVGQDCNPGSVNGMLKVQEDMYGSCMPNTITTGNLASYNNGQTTKSCQTSCPGECETGLIGPSSAPKKVDLADRFVRDDTLPRLPVRANVIYSEIVNNAVGNPAVLKIGQAVNPSSLSSNNTVTTMTKALDNVASTRSSNPGNVTPMYEAIDKAIDRLRTNGLDADPNSPASLIIYGSRADTNCLSTSSNTGWFGIIGGLLGGSFLGTVGMIIDNNTNSGCTQWYQSRYFGRNFCEPEQVPTGWTCEYCSNRIQLPGGSWSCIGSKATKQINMSELRDRGISNTLSDGYAINSPQARQNWCTDQEWEDDCPPWGLPGPCLKHYKTWDIHPNYGGTRGTGRPAFDNDGSLVGFLGRTYPNLKINYMDFEGDTNGHSLGTMCSSSPSYNINSDPNVFFVKNGVPKQIMATYVTTDIDDLKTAIIGATGGGKPDAEAGKAVCQAKYGTSVNIDYGNPPQVFNNNLTSFESQTTSGCSAALLYNPNTQSGVSSNATMVPSTVHGGSTTCVNGFKPYTLKTPC